MKMDQEIAALAELPPAQWDEALRRFAVVRNYLSLDRSTVRNPEAHARGLGLNVRSFYRLIEAYRELQESKQPRRSQRGAQRHLPSEVDQVIADVRSELGCEASDRLVHLEVQKRCHEAGIPEPSYSSIRTRSAGSLVDLRIKLRRRCDLVLDACPVSFDVFQDGADDGLRKVAWLTGVFAAEHGTLLGHLLTAGEATPIELSEMLRDALRRGAAGTMVATGESPQILMSIEPELHSFGVRLDNAGSRGLQAGVAITSVLGRKIGKIFATPKRRELLKDSEAVPLNLARRVVTLLLTSTPGRS
jgi:hypothetical protein